MDHKVPVEQTSWLEAHPYLGMLAGLIVLLILIYVVIWFYKMKPGGDVDV